MYGEIEARNAAKTYKVYFPSPKAAIPVLGAGGEVLGWVRWGRRKGELGASPQGGWAKLKTIEHGGWEKYKPSACWVWPAVHRKKALSGPRTGSIWRQGSPWIAYSSGKANNSSSISPPPHRHLNMPGHMIVGRC